MATIAPLPGLDASHSAPLIKRLLGAMKGNPGITAVLVAGVLAAGSHVGGDSNNSSNNKAVPIVDPANPETNSAVVAPVGPNITASAEISAPQKPVTPAAATTPSKPNTAGIQIPPNLTHRAAPAPLASSTTVNQNFYPVDWSKINTNRIIPRAALEQATLYLFEQGIIRTKKDNPGSSEGETLWSQMVTKLKANKFTPYSPQSVEWRLYRECLMATGCPGSVLDDPEMQGALTAGYQRVITMATQDGKRAAAMIAFKKTQ